MQKFSSFGRKKKNRPKFDIEWLCSEVFNCYLSNFKGALSQGFCCAQVNSVLKSLLSTFTHITYKGALSQGFCCVQVNSVLNSLLTVIPFLVHKMLLENYKHIK